MTLGFIAAGANVALDAFNAAFPWIKLHTGDPGSAGTANAAANATRKQSTANAAAGGAAEGSADVVWSSGQVTTTETYTHFTRWSAVTGGSVGGSGTVTGGAVTAGTAFTLAAADLDSSLPLAT